MKTVERKYRVADFRTITALLEGEGAERVDEQATTHLYARRTDTHVSKLVVYEDRCEIHELTEQNGTFELTLKKPVSSEHAGRQWLAQHGYDDLQTLTMHAATYSYDNARIGLYTINKSLMSVIIEAEPERLDELEQRLNLAKVERISVPYNVYIKGE